MIGLELGQAVVFTMSTAPLRIIRIKEQINETNQVSSPFIIN